VWRSWLNWVCTENGLWIKLGEGVSYAETVEKENGKRTLKMMIMIMMIKMIAKQISKIPKF